MIHMHAACVSIKDYKISAHYGNIVSIYFIEYIIRVLLSKITLCYLILDTFCIALLSTYNGNNMFVIFTSNEILRTLYLTINGLWFESTVTSPSFRLANENLWLAHLLGEFQVWRRKGSLPLSILKLYICLDVSTKKYHDLHKHVGVDMCTTVSTAKMMLTKVWMQSFHVLLVKHFHMEKELWGEGDRS